MFFSFFLILRKTDKLNNNSEVKSARWNSSNIMQQSVVQMANKLESKSTFSYIILNIDKREGK